MQISRRIGRFTLDRRILVMLALAGVVLAGRAWLGDHPQHDPWAPLDLGDPPGWATQAKLVALRSDPAQCRAVLERSGIEFRALDPAGEGECRRDDRTVLANAPLAPGPPASTCPVAAGFALWQRRSLEPAARDILGSPIARIEHFGTYSCRRMYGASEGRWSEHATGNAIDIAAFVLEDGRRVSVLGDWQGDGEAAHFLRKVRDDACEIFATVLSPDYNEAHADHFHLDQSGRYTGVCR
ncbi:extensin family protein [Alteriqipengyuania flavescens]|uniref:extensin-like domain-containing protein n=1 Tax=Alteriqipengyuania flavescens TaxID=3053610 RepID=UPI0025B486C0|nr:extensin family protein [Alteriqipengyuania flavescens]WJY18392.1 extensin family protein [Alteriqipengyuania flavescens]WJY24333.1 extensin family protein [Alteriqipengyuania flavescens]